MSVFTTQFFLVPLVNSHLRNACSSGILSGRRMPNRISPQPVRDLVWRISDNVCALADADRHLGHAIQLEPLAPWHAYDATRLNASGDGFRYLGKFGTAADAKTAVEASVSTGSPSLALKAGGAH